MTALIRMRLAGFFHGGRVLAPLIAVLVVLGVLYGGGASPAATAYGYSAAALFPILAWLAKVVLDTEPDVQRRLARLAVGPVREGLAGLLAATLAGAAVCAAAMLTPWAFHAIRGPEPGSAEASLPAGILLGVLAHLLALPAAVALGALSGRAVTRRILPGVAVLVTGSLLVVVLGLNGSFAPWLAPPVMAVARVLTDGAVPPAAELARLTIWSLAWCTVALATYGWLRRARS
ncbi:hypothetical protein ACWT_0653 [Actinoplanes sp. SE50]|uniref:hypothetical protein n=1 Tax=unclassified Actinoplanes TaxID=2626549 RepID=UPI00023ED362|nr:MULTISPECIES: hypothetical protein [unclassified Actinoplanes]AEV81667.1 hypothetical protein ACPL_770 [Actinoplanes sp. SE50/110]ATO80068.1 hypothetical protein ACWT_0653 [Actinoplanes sp. SE50]SLL97472.1 hypothetical protein ACSP50_0679 [Actinoplanes sp. SE50/110]